MRGLKKKILGLGLTFALTAGVLTGCSSMKADDVIVTVGDKTIQADMANFYIRYQQAIMETNYGSFMGGAAMWKQEVEKGKTYAESMKEDVAKSMGQMFLLENHMGEYEVTITEEEKAKIDDATENFLKANSDKAKKLISASQETVARVMELLTIQNKMFEAMTADVNTEVSDDEAAQKSMQYVKFAFATTDDEGKSKELNDAEKEELKKSAEAFAEGAKTAEDFSAYATESGYKATDSTFDKESTSPDAAVIEAADTLAEGETTGLIETTGGYYVAKVTSLLDRAATDAKKGRIVDERKQTQYEDLLKTWTEETKIKVDKKNLKKIDLNGAGVTVKQAEQEESKTEE